VRYYWRRIGWPDALDGVPVDSVFYQRPTEPGADVVPAIGESLVRFVQTHLELQPTDVVYAHWLWTGSAAALMLRERFGWPVVAIARGSEMHNWQTIHPHCRPYVKQVLREADCVLTNCEALREQAETLVPGSAARIEVIYNGCDAEKFRPAADRAEVRRALQLDLDSRILLFCGDIIERKGIPELAEAWHSFSAVHPDWQLVLVGRGVDVALVARLRDVGNGRVVFTGRVPHERVVKYMQAADAYVQPSRLEGLANATMEAMAVGLPVITTDTCGQRELIGDGENGWLVPPGDATALGRALESLARDPDLARRFGQAARRTIETTFNPQPQAARLAEILKRTAGRRATASQGHRAVVN
jgi:glycosyltransferase involved in cell wall biosynthesis